jgi:hypothetical protein
MPLEELLTLLRARPFIPFRIHLSDGSSHDVRYMEMCLPLARSVVVGIPGPQLPPLVADRYVNIALAHVTRLEPLPAAVSQEGTGAAR